MCYFSLRETHGSCILISKQNFQLKLEAQGSKLTAQNYSAIIALTVSITSSALGLEK